MDHANHVVRVRIEPLGERLRRDDIAQFCLGNVAPFLARAESVAHRHSNIALAERCNYVGSDESGTTGNEDHCLN